MIRNDLVDFQVAPAESGWYGVICLAGAGKTRRLPLYWTGGDWQEYPTFPWFRSAKRFETAAEAQTWLEGLPE